MISGCIFKFGVGPLLFFNGSIDSILNLELLKKTVKPFLRRLISQGKENPVYIDDNAPVHRARIEKDWISGSNIFNPTRLAYFQLRMFGST